MKEIYRAWFEGISRDSKSFKLPRKSHVLTAIMVLILLAALALYILFYYHAFQVDAIASVPFLISSLICFIISIVLGLAVDRTNATERE